MNRRQFSAVFIVFFVFSIIVISQVSSCQTTTPSTSTQVSPTQGPTQGSPFNLLLIGGIAAVVIVVAIAAFLLITRKRGVNEKKLRKFSSSEFEDWVTKKFNGKPSNPGLGINGFTEGGQPLLIKQSDHVGLSEVANFVDALIKGKAQKGTVVAFNFDNDTLEARVKAMDNEIQLEMLRVSELLNKRFANKIRSLAQSQVTFDASAAPMPMPTVDPALQTEMLSFKKMPSEPGTAGTMKPRVFISNSNTKVAEQVKRMLDFLHYDYVMGDKEQTTVPIPEGKLNVMKNCDCAVINIAAAEQERRYSGIYILNSNVISEINAAYLKYNTQVILLVERKIELPPNLKGLKRIEYDSDDLSFNAAMDLNKALADFGKI